MFCVLNFRFFIIFFVIFLSVFIKAYFVLSVLSNKQTCKIISLNVRGIRNSIKSSSIFAYLKDQKATFYFLQETYSESREESFWKNEWGGEIFFSHGTRHSKGACILLNPSIKENKIKNSLSDNSGRIVENNCNFYLNTEDFLFGVSSVSSVPCRVLNYTLFFLRNYIYKKKL